MLGAGRLRGLSPFGPIFGKELRIASRRKRNHLLRVLYLGVLLILLLIAYTSNARYGPGSTVWRIEQQNRLGADFFAVFSIFCIISMGVIAPVLTSTAIGSERLARTLPVLLMTPITAWQIVSGKLFSRLLVALMLIGLSLPVLALVRLLGGVELWQMVAVICVCTAFAMSSAALGLLYSTLTNRAYAVILLSYATMFAGYVLLPMFLVTIVFGNRGNSPALFYLIAAINPGFNVTFTAMPEGGPFRMGSQWITGAAVQVLLTGALLVCSAGLLRRAARRMGESAGPSIASTEAAPADAAGTIPAAGSALPPLPSRDVGDNPILWRELRQPLMARRWQTVLGTAVAVLLLLISYGSLSSVGALHDDDVQIGYACVFNGLVWLLASVLSATCIAHERETDTLTLLLTAPLSSRCIIIGKLLGLGRRMLGPLFLIALHFVAFAVGGVISAGACIFILWIIIGFNAIWAATGVYLSLRVRSVTLAVILNLMIAPILFLLVPVLLLLICEMTSSSQRAAEWTFWYIPYCYFAMGIDWLSPYASKFRAAPGGGSLSVGRFVWITFAVGLIHIGLALLIVKRTIRGFDRLAGRAA